MKDTLLLLGGLYLLSKSASSSAPTATAGQQPQQQKPSSSAGGTGAAAGQGASATAGRGGAPKQGGGASNIFSVEDIFPNFEGPSVIDGMLAEQNAGTDVPPPSFTDFLQPTEEQTNATFGNLFPAGEQFDAPVFGGDPSLQIDENGLVIDPSTGQPFGAGDPNVVDLTGQVGGSAIFDQVEDTPDLFVPSGDLPDDFFV